MTTYKELTRMEALALEKAGVSGVEICIKLMRPDTLDEDYWAPAGIFYLDRQHLFNRFRVAVE